MKIFLIFPLLFLFTTCKNVDKTKQADTATEKPTKPAFTPPYATSTEVKKQWAQGANFYEVKTITPPKDITKRAKNVIFLIGDGMGLTQLYAAMTANKGKLHIESCTHLGLIKTYASDAYITDSAAGATAFACGAKTYNGAIGVDAQGNPVKTILEMAEEQGLATGLVATSSITHATPASFIAHQKSRKMEEEIAADFLNTDIEVFIGGGKKFFEHSVNDKNLLLDLKAKGYQVLDNMKDITAVKQGKLAGFTAQEQNPKYSEGRGDMLLQSTRTALNILSQNKKGFFLMVEGSQIDWGGHNNDAQYVIDEAIDFDKVIGEVLEFAAKDGETLVVITADHETGGLTLVGGNIQEGKVQASFSTGGHTAVMVPVYAFGVQADKFSGIYENTSIFNRLKQSMGL